MKADIERGLKAGAAAWLITTFSICAVFLFIKGFSIATFSLFLLLPYLPLLMFSGLIFAIFYDKIPTNNSLSKGAVVFLILALFAVIYLHASRINVVGQSLTLIFSLIGFIFIPILFFSSYLPVTSLVIPIYFLVLGLLLGFFWDKFEATESSAVATAGGLAGYLKKHSWVIAPAMLSFFIIVVCILFVLDPCLMSFCPSKTVPEKCTFPVSLTCIDHSVSINSMTFILLNGAGRDMVVQSVTVSSTALGTGSGNDACGTPAGTINFTKDATATFTLNTAVSGGSCTFKNTGRDKNKYNITVTYSWVDSPTITHQLNGELLARKP